jgi:hypothetical protein
MAGRGWQQTGVREGTGWKMGRKRMAGGQQKLGGKQQVGMHAGLVWRQEVWQRLQCRQMLAGC